MLRHCGLFEGIGGFTKAAEQVGGIQTTQFVEINPDAQTILRDHFPHIPIHDDIRTYGDRSLTSRPAGQTKCERWFKENGLIPPGYQLSAPAMALMMGFPEDWFDCLSPPIIEDGSEPDTSPEGLSSQHRQRPPSNGFSASTTSSSETVLMVKEEPETVLMVKPDQDQLRPATW